MRLIDADEIGLTDFEIILCEGSYKNVLGTLLEKISNAQTVELPSAQPEPHWIPCSERLPERIIDGDGETVQEFFVTVKERWPEEKWEYHTDVAWFPGDYIDDLWDTYNDWKEGQEVHIIAWMPLPETYKGEQ